ncbi:glycosyltransferase [Collinsella sp. LCP21S3_E4]|uniref:glycosyltransferase n=1 Tax=Collinsella sp. LCP21S3_E4 TaxID=3438774 RepID=UPI003F8F6A31
MTSLPLVSVLMPCYRETADEFSESLDSILLQTYSRIEVIIVFDDPNNDVLYRIAESRADYDNRIRLIKNERNLGLSKALTKAFEFSHGEYICRMDSDDISVKYRIEHQFDYLRENNLDLIGSYLNAINENGEVLYLVDAIPSSAASVKRALAIRNCVPHPSWFGKRAVFELGYRSVPLAEDYDLLLRALQAGFSVGNVPEPLIYYRMTADSISRKNLYDQYLVSRILSSAYKRGHSLDVKEIAVRISFRSDQRVSMNYLKANNWFNNGLQLLTAGKKMQGLFQLARIPFISRAYCKNLFNMVRVVAIKRLG